MCGSPAPLQLPGVVPAAFSLTGCCLQKQLCRIWGRGAGVGELRCACLQRERDVKWDWESADWKMLHNLTERVLPAGINPIYWQSLVSFCFFASHSLCNSCCVSAAGAGVLWSTGVILPGTSEKCPVNALKPECSISPRKCCPSLQDVLISRLHLMNFCERV